MILWFCDLYGKSVPKRKYPSNSFLQMLDIRIRNEKVQFFMDLKNVPDRWPRLCITLHCIIYDRLCIWNVHFLYFSQCGVSQGIGSQGLLKIEANSLSLLYLKCSSGRAGSYLQLSKSFVGHPSFGTSRVQPAVHKKDEWISSWSSCLSVLITCNFLFRVNFYTVLIWGYRDVKYFEVTPSLILVRKSFTT